MYQVLYRKWRPRTFSEVCGQPTVTTALKNELQSGRLAHAYLFTGSRGTGKTTCAKILAKAVNCLHPVNGDPCNACENCRGIDAGTVPDVMEIDAASNNGVDNIRDLRDEVNYAPVIGKYRVYIIDEVHMLSAGAFNALLKTLEEPPEHVLFILATTEVHKLPATILSRCQRFDFGRISPMEIADRLHYVAQQEQFLLSEDAALLIARLADGGMRDALSMLDQCLSCSRDVTADIVTQATGMAGRDHLFSLAEAVRTADTGTALSLVNTLYEKSKDMERLCAELVEFYRNLMILKSVKNPADLILASPAEIDEMRALAEKISLTDIIRIMDLLQTTLDRLKGGVSRRVEMETALLRLCDSRLDATPQSLLVRIEALESGHAVKIPVAEADKRSPTPNPDSALSQKPAATVAVPVPASEAHTCEEWPEILSQIAKVSPPLYGVLAGSTAMRDGDCLNIVTENDMFGALVQSDGNKKVLLGAVSAVLGKPMRIRRVRPSKPQAAVEESDDPLSSFLRRSAQAGVTIDMKG